MFPFVPGISWSDHRSFWRQRYRAVMITDTAFYRYRHYHSPTDTPDKLAYPELTRVTSGLCAAFSELALEASTEGQDANLDPQGNVSLRAQPFRNAAWASSARQWPWPL